MPVNSTHPHYDAVAPFWMMMRDAIAGEDAIKERGSAYLPIPPSVDTTKGERSPEYRNYKSRARYPTAVHPAVEGMAGLMGREGTTIELPAQLEYLREEATPDGLTLDDLLDRLRHEVTGVGRYILLVDAPQEGGDPFIATYPAEALINWRHDGGTFTMAVFHEVVREQDPSDEFVDILVDQWRQAVVVDGTYTVRVWRRQKENDSRFEIVEEVVPTRQGTPLSFVPAVAVGSRDLLPDPDAIPLLGVANKALHYYRQYADYGLQLFMAANGTTPYAIGVSEDATGETGNEPPSEIGPSTIWTFASKDVSVGYIEVSGNGLAAQKAELDSIAKEIAQAAMQALGDNGRGTEAAEALRLRFQSQTATLASIANATATGLELALSYAAQWVGADENAVNVTTSTEFIREQPDPQVLSGLLNGVERGLMPETILSSYLRRVQLTDMSDEDFAAFTPAAQALASGGVEG